MPGDRHPLNHGFLDYTVWKTSRVENSVKFIACMLSEAGVSCRTTAFLRLFSSGDHFYQSECSTDHPTLVPLASKLRFSVFFTNVQSKRTTRAEPEDHLWSADHSLRNAAVRESRSALKG
jgi:hypothetical protein